MATEPETVDLAAMEEDDIPSIPATDPVPAPETGMTYAELYLTQYLPLVVGMAGHTKDPRMGTQLRLKAADVALQLTFSIISKQQAAA